MANCFQQNINRVEEVLERIRAAGLKLKLEKCSMLQQEVVYLSNVGLVARKPVFGVSDKASFQLVFSATETS